MHTFVSGLPLIERKNTLSYLGITYIAKYSYRHGYDDDETILLCAQNLMDSQLSQLFFFASAAHLWQLDFYAPYISVLTYLLTYLHNQEN